MEAIISILEFIAKKRSFRSLFVVFTAIYFCLFLGLLFCAPEELSELTLIQNITSGILLPLCGGLMGTFTWKLMSFSARESLEVQKEKMK